MVGDDEDDDDHLMGDTDDVKDILQELNIGVSSKSEFTGCLPSPSDC